MNGDSEQLGPASAAVDLTEDEFTGGIGDGAAKFAGTGGCYVAVGRHVQQNQHAMRRRTFLHPHLAIDLKPL